MPPEGERTVSFLNPSTSRKAIDAVYCHAYVEEHPIYLILDSGSSGSIISKSFLEKLNRPIEAPSHINMIDINGRCTKSLRKVTNIPIQLDRVIIPINADVSESKDYFIVAGNDWITDVKGVLDWHYGYFTFNFKNQYHRITIIC